MNEGQRIKIGMLEWWKNGMLGKRNEEERERKSGRTAEWVSGRVKVVRFGANTIEKLPLSATAWTAGCSPGAPGLPTESKCVVPVRREMLFIL